MPSNKLLGLHGVWRIINILITLLILISIIFILKKSIVDDSRFYQAFSYLLSCTLISIALFGVLIAFKYESSDDPKLWNVEWPIGNAHQVLKLNTEVHVALHNYLPRIQIYDSSLNYLIGWKIPKEVYRNDFNLYPNDAQSFYLYSYRGSKKFLMDLNGNLLDEQDKPASMPIAKEVIYNFSIPTNFWFSIFSKQVYLGLIFGLGIFMIYIVKKCKPNKSFKSD